eukprot:CAMPEP_0183347996 /NCGR_PEP_ID=MMETSP0164_2-20130417/12657_1 /TAXON_ID=221442 /ORGANISM="Coccolithus pelagicus ssp braarudi, Strain PLY182g" /LENGTH=133 /DNA_ID=CAMNT_0025519531 /DNA_START=66 /DNA_END=468 /DNA_ORIENTATION=+
MAGAYDIQVVKICDLSHIAIVVALHPSEGIIFTKLCALKRRSLCINGYVVVQAAAKAPSAAAQERLQHNFDSSPGGKLVGRDPVFLHELLARDLWPVSEVLRHVQARDAIARGEGHHRARGPSRALRGRAREG